MIPALALALACAKTAPPVAAADISPGVILVDPGAEPRRELRYSLAEGSTSQSRVMTLTSARFFEDSGPVRGGEAPRATCVDLELISGEGDFDVAISVITPYPEVFAKNPGDPCHFKGPVTLGRGRATVTSTGLVTPDEWIGSGDWRLDGLLTLITPFPKEAIGVGAQWKMQRDASSAELNAVEEIVWTLTAIEGDAMRVDASIVLHPIPGESPMPQIETTAPVTLVHWEQVGEETRTVDLSSLAASKSFRSIEGTVEVSIGEGDAAATVRMEIITNISVDATRTQ